MDDSQQEPSLSLERGKGLVDDWEFLKELGWEAERYC